MLRNHDDSLPGVTRQNRSEDGHHFLGGLGEV
jgi:hypothetical protein